MISDSITFITESLQIQTERQITLSQSQQFPESYETMLKKIKDYDPAKYELHRTAAGRDEVNNFCFESLVFSIYNTIATLETLLIVSVQYLQSAHEGAPESSGVQKDDDTQPTVTKPDKVGENVH